MRIRFYGYNSFLIQSGDMKIAIDPGALFCYWFRFSTLIPRAEWKGITHILVTHGDPDHYWHADRMAKESGAVLVCNKTLVRNVDGRDLLLGPRDRGLAFTTELARVRTLSPNETVDVDGVSVTGIKTVHGQLVLRLGPFARTFRPGPDERVGWGAIGYEIRLAGKRLVNLGDTLLLENEWQEFAGADLLMIPIGGGTIHNTMDVGEALRAVHLLRPGRVIPCHYNCPALFTEKYNPADDVFFKSEVEKAGIECIILGTGDAVELNHE